METATTPKQQKGFAVMTPEKVRSIASLGGRKAHQLNKAHKFTSDEAREAGRKGGEIISKNRDHMAAIGRIGGKHRGGKPQAAITV
jgi:general stress protein YciG